MSFPGRVVSLSCGYYHAAAVLDDGRLFTWGEADGGKLGLIHVTSSQLEPQVGRWDEAVLPFGRKNLLVSINGSPNHNLEIY